MQIFDLSGMIRVEGIQQLTSQLNGLSGTLNNVGSKVSGFGSSLTNFGSRLTAGVTVPVAGLVYQGLKFNSSMENLKTSFEVMLGSAENAGIMVDKLKKMGAATPFETEQLAEYTKTMLSFGYTSKNVLPIMSRLGDVSLGNSEKMASMTRTMGQINSLGKLQGGDLNQLISYGWNPLNEIMKKTGETTEEVRKRMSKGKITYKEVEDALVKTTSKGGTFYQGMIKGSATLSGKLSTLSDNFKEMLGNATKPLFDFIANKAVPFLTELISKFNKLDPIVKTSTVVFVALAAAIGPLLLVGGLLIGTLGSVITGIGTVVGILTSMSLPIGLAVGAIGALALSFGGLLLSSHKVRNGIINGFNNIKDKVVSVASTVKDNIENIKKLFGELMIGMTTGNFGGIAKPLTDIKSNIANKNETNQGAYANARMGGGTQGTNEFAGLVKTLEDTRTKIVGLKDAIINVGKSINTYIAPIVENLSNIFKKLDFASTKNSLDSLSNSFKALQPLFSLIGSAILVLSGVLYGLQAAFAAGLLKSLPYVIGFLSNMVTVVMDVIKVITDLATANSSISDSIVKLWDDITMLLNSGADAITSFLSGFYDTIVDVFTSIYNVLVGNSIVPDMINGIVSWFSKLPGLVGAKIASLASSVISKFLNLASRAKSSVASLVSGVIGKFASLASQARAKVESMKSAVISAFSNLKNSMVKVGSNIINGLISGIGSKGGALISKAKSIANSVTNTFTNVLEIFSPSRKMLKIGQNVIQGLVIGLNHGSLPNTLKVVSKSIITAFFTTTNKVKEYFSSIKSNIQQQLSDIKSTAVSEVDNMASIAGEALKRKHEQEFNAKKKADLKLAMARLKNAKNAQDFEKAQNALNKVNAREYVAISESKLNKEVLALLKNKNKLKALLKKYYADWQNAGQSIGDKLINGLNSKKSSMGKAIDNFFKKLSEAAKINVGKVNKELDKLQSKYSKIVSSLGKTASKIEALKAKIEKTKKGKTKNAMIKEVKQLEKELRDKAKKQGLTYKDGHIYFPNGVEAFASGVRNFKGGMALVGERGPELINLPRGSSVYSNKDSSRMLKSSIDALKSSKQENFIMNGNITIDSKNVKDINDVINIFKQIKKEAILR